MKAMTIRRWCGESRSCIVLGRSWEESSSPAGPSVGVNLPVTSSDLGRAEVYNLRFMGICHRVYARPTARWTARYAPVSAAEGIGSRPVSRQVYGIRIGQPVAGSGQNLMTADDLRDPRGDMMSGILLLEDEPIIAQNICRALGRGGHMVTHAASAREARHQLAAARFDLVLADVNLGDGDGIEVLSSTGAPLGDVPIVIMTGQDRVDNRLRAEGLAVSAFLSKPFAMSRLAELTGALLAETGKQAGIRRGPSVLM
ncbi:MAG: response regulator [Rhodobacteraceae bacterium]|nr:response regulator [Paracoccaceae bacterium]